MLDTTLGFLRDQLSAYLDSRYPSGEGLVVLSGLVNLSGTPPPAVENKIVLSLVNVEREAIARNLPGEGRSESGFSARINPPLNLNLYVLVSASFDTEYLQALRLMSEVLGYFQGLSVFTPQSAGPLPPGLERLTMEVVNLDIQGLNNMWAIMGGKYLPSVLYKVRMFTVQEGWVREQIPEITGTDTGA